MNKYGRKVPIGKVIKRADWVYNFMLCKYMRARKDGKYGPSELIGSARIGSKVEDGHDVRRPIHTKVGAQRRAVGTTSLRFGQRLANNRRGCSAAVPASDNPSKVAMAVKKNKKSTATGNR